jgi:uncharacterized protein with NAD-binding domain and iron-sulfur cluster
MSFTVDEAVLGDELCIALQCSADLLKNGDPTLEEKAAIMRIVAQLVADAKDDLGLDEVLDLIKAQLDAGATEAEIVLAAALELDCQPPVPANNSADDIEGAIEPEDSVENPCDTKPKVTIFGGGISGLSAAHELAERGFQVQVVESTPDDRNEAICKVGGMAATQYSSIKETGLIYPELEECLPSQDTPQAEDENLESTSSVAVMGGSGSILAKSRPEGKERNPKPGEWSRWDTLPSKSAKPLPEDWTAFQRRLILGGDEASEGELCELICQLRSAPDTHQARPRFPTNYSIPVDLRGDFTTPATSNTGINPRRVDYGIDTPDRMARMVKNTSLGLRQGLMTLEKELAVSALTRDLSLLPLEVLIRETLVAEIFGMYLGNAEADKNRAWAAAMEVKKVLTNILDTVFDKVSQLDEDDVALMSEASINYKPQTESDEPDSLYFIAIRNYNHFVSLGLIDYQNQHRSVADHFVISARNYFDGIPRSPQRYALAAEISTGESAAVSLEVVEKYVAGEHGYRFFPAWYRHVFDTMRRTPLFDRHKNATYRSVFNRLMSPPPAALAEKGRGFKSVPRSQIQSLTELRQQFKIVFEDLHCTDRDFLRFQNRMFKFMTSCQERRKRYENMSWLGFLDGQDELVDADPEELEDRTYYSPAAEDLLLDMSKALNGIQGDHVDARTYGLTSVQMARDYMNMADDKDMLLNGPTSESWMRPWKEYLKRIGVRFYLGCFEKFVSDGEELLPVARGPDGAIDPIAEDPRFPYQRFKPEQGDDDPEQFFLMAIPYEWTTEKIWEYWRQQQQNDGLVELDNDLEAIRCFDRDDANRHGRNGVPNRPGGITSPPSQTSRLATGAPNQPFHYPMRDFFGLQCYFNKLVQYGDGYLYFLNSEWGLTSISQRYFWRRRLSLMKGFLGLVSIDIGDAYTPYESAGIGNVSAWNCSRLEMESLTFEQMQSVLPGSIAKTIPPPQITLVDKGLVFDLNGSVLYNKTPFFTQIAGQNKRKIAEYSPEARLARFHAGSIHRTNHEYDDFENILYRISNKRWLVAGNFMPTHTRISTMESAMESGRIAVNAILHNLLTSGIPTDQIQIMTESELEALEIEPQGTFCEIFPPEQHELPDLNWLKDMDRCLMAEGLPHFLDILCTLQLIDALPDEEAEGPSKPEMIRKLMYASSIASEKASGGKYRPDNQAANRIEQIVKMYLQAFRDKPGNIDKIYEIFREIPDLKDKLKDLLP